MAPPHLHPRQDEHFEVLDGAVRAIIEGVARRYTAGDAFDVPAGMVHQMGGDGPARVKWEVRPALKAAQLAEDLYGGRRGG
jgi:quercetin dioxygenase-like cupin family protein